MGKIPIEKPGDGIERQMVVGQKVMMCRFRFRPFLVTPQHTHPHEQIALVIQGKVKFHISDEERILNPGDVLFSAE